MWYLGRFLWYLNGKNSRPTSAFLSLTSLIMICTLSTICIIPDWIYIKPNLDSLKPRFEASSEYDPSVLMGGGFELAGLSSARTQAVRITCYLSNRFVQTWIFNVRSNRLLIDVDRRDKVTASPELIPDNTTRLVGHFLVNLYQILADQSRKAPLP